MGLKPPAALVVIARHFSAEAVRVRAVASHAIATLRIRSARNDGWNLCHFRGLYYITAYLFMLQFSKPSSMATNREVFDQIAESWYQVRHWPLLRQELEELAERWRGGKLLNVGCAHGPDFLPFRERFELFGVDSSPGMLKQALRYSAKFSFYANLIVAHATSLPFPDDTFDWAVAVATYHHIKGHNERRKAFCELRRVLKPGGEAFLTVWNHGQRRFWLKSKDQEVPWRLRGRTVYRYYHLFSYGEIKKLLSEAGFEIIRVSPEKSYHLPIRSFSRNICALIEKRCH